MLDTIKDFWDFREIYNTFIYHNYSYELKEDSLHIEFDFEIENLIRFKPTWTIERSYHELDEKVLRNLIFNLGMAELVSYWKAVCSKNIEIRCGYLDDTQKKWWEKLYKLGLGEFLYLNNIQIDTEFLTFHNKGDKIDIKNANELKIPANIKNTKVMIPIGGGKDSIVSIQLLKNQIDPVAYIINPRGATTKTFEISEIKTLITAKRTLDSNLFKLNEQGFLNGHTPFSAIVAFSAVISSYINGISYIALSNEASANESTVEGTDINHQYSKTIEFENDFRLYETNYLKANTSYFSLLRTSSELRIASFFAKYKQYHNIFRSCNVGSKADIWCGNCPKCLFVYIILAPYISPLELEEIFGSNLFDNKNLLEDFRKLIGLETEKPFECVGSCDEVNASLQFIIEKHYKNIKAPFLIEYYKETYKGLSYDIADFEKELDVQNNIPTFIKFKEI